jgi:hypothetical protein
VPFSRRVQLIPTAADSLPNDEKLVEAAACSESFEYFLANYVYILDPEFGKIKFEMWPVHSELAGFIIACDRIIILKARQLGVSWLLAAYALWKASFKDGANVLMLSKREDEAKSLLGKSFFIYQNLPLFLRRKIHKHNETEISFEDNITPDVASTAIKAFPSTEDAGRSEAASDVICDEWAYHPYAEVNYGAYKPTIDAGGKLIGVSTANGIGNFFQKTYAASKVPSDNWTPQNPIGKNGFVPLFLGWYLRPSRNKNWYSNQVSEYSETPHLLAQEYPASDIDAFISSGNSYFNKEKVHLWMQFCRTPVENHHGGIIKYWKYPVFGERYIAGADCAEGRGEDMSGMALYHLRTMEHVADIHGDLTPDEFADFVVSMCTLYNNAFLCVERNSVGVGVIIDIVKRHNYTNLLKYRPIQNSLKLGKSAQIEFARNEEYGWPTNQVTRPYMLRDLSSHISTGTITSPDKGFWDECITFVNVRGKLQAADGCKDDRVFKHALAIQAAKNFEEQDIKEQTREQNKALILRGSV